MKAEEYEENGIPLIRVSNCRTGEILIDEELVYISEEKHRQLIRSEVLPGDVLVTKAGHILGYSAVFPDFLQRGNITSHLAAIRPTKNINPHFLSLFLSSSIGNHQIYRWGNKATRPELNTDEVREILVPLPPLAVQRSMVEEMEQARESRRRKLTEAEALLDGLDDFILSNLGLTMPNMGTQLGYGVKLGNCLGTRIDAFFHRSGFYSLMHTLTEKLFRYLGDITIRIVSGRRPAGGVGQIEAGTISFGGEHITENGEIRNDNLRFVPKSFHIANLYSATQKYDILLVKDGATTGRVGLLSNSQHANQNINEHIFLIRAKENINPVFLFAVMKSSIVQQQIKRNITGSAQTGITREGVTSLRIPVPSEHIQAKIANEVLHLRNESERLRIEATQEWKAAKEHFEARLLGERNS